MELNCIHTARRVIEYTHKILIYKKYNNKHLIKLMRRTQR